MTDVDERIRALEQENALLWRENHSLRTRLIRLTDLIKTSNNTTVETREHADIT